jgi:hypothetical protein
MKVVGHISYNPRHWGREGFVCTFVGPHNYSGEEFQALERHTCFFLSSIKRLHFLLETLR